MVKLHLSAFANDDLLLIKEYIEMELKNPAAATNTLVKIIRSLRRLADFPLSGAPLSSIMEFETDYRQPLKSQFRIAQF